MSANSAVYIANANQLVGTVVEPANTLVAVDSTVRDAFVANSAGSALDKLTIDLHTGYAKVAQFVLSFTGSTPISIDLTNVATATGTQVAGVASFATWNQIVMQMVGGTTCAISPGASNPLRNGLGGTSPTFTLNAGESTVWQSAAGQTVDSTHKVLTFTPGAAGVLLIGIGGA